MVTPRIEINLKKISHNAKTLIKLYSSKGISISAVTKAVCGDPEIAAVLVKTKIKIIADSRIENIKKMSKSGIKATFLLLRSPALSEVRSVIQYADISLNSELSVIKKLSLTALSRKTKHKIILMVELGDLREGVMPVDLNRIVEEVIQQKGIIVAGIGANFACFGGVKPDNEKMAQLSSLSKDIEEKYDLKFDFVSGGNSANYQWFQSTDDVGKVNNLRLGESIFLGKESLKRETIPGLFTDAFRLVTEVIESKNKPSKPNGDICQDVSGNVPNIPDNGEMRRVILGVGLQDVLVDGLTPDIDIDILGASSDHLIIDSKKKILRVGDEVGFNLNYGALLSAMTSPYIKKKYRHLMTRKNQWPNRYQMVYQ